jgi:hypothetical protein
MKYYIRLSHSTRYCLTINHDFDHLRVKFYAEFSTDETIYAHPSIDDQLIGSTTTRDSGVGDYFI